MISRTPRLIARCADVADVITAVHFGRRHGLRMSIRGGGHNAGGLGVCDDGLVIDLSLIKFVHVDAAERTVRVGNLNHDLAKPALLAPILGSDGAFQLALRVSF